MKTQLGIVAGGLARGSGKAAAGAVPVIVVAAGTHGVGTSSVSAALAVEFANAGRDTLLVDNSDDFRLVFDANPAGANHTLAALHTGVDPQALLLPGGPRLQIIAGEHAAIATSRAERRLILRHITDLFARFDVVVVDAGSRAASVLDVCAYHPAALMAVSSADPIVGASTYALVKLLRVKHPRIPVWVLENRESDGDGFVAWGRIAECASRFLGGAPLFAGTLPEAPAIRSRLTGHIALTAPTSEFDPATPVVADIAKQLLASFDPPSSPTALFSHRFQDSFHGNSSNVANSR